MQAISPAGLSGKPAGFRKFTIPVIWGIGTGIVLAVLSVLLYQVVMPQHYRAFMFVSFLMNYLPLIQILFYIGAGLHQRKAAGGYLTFREAFSAVFVVILIANAILLIWNIIYPLYLDPALPQRIKQYDAAFMQSMNTPQADIDAKMKSWDAQLEPGISFSGVLGNYVRILAMNAAFGLLAAAIARHKRPQ